MIKEQTNNLDEPDIWQFNWMICERKNILFLSGNEEVVSKPFSQFRLALDDKVRITYLKIIPWMLQITKRFLIPNAASFLRKRRAMFYVSKRECSDNSHNSYYVRVDSIQWFAHCWQACFKPRFKSYRKWGILSRAVLYIFWRKTMQFY